MKRDDLIDAIGTIDADMIEAVDALRAAKKKKSAWKKWGVMAACCTLCLLLGYRFLQGGNFFTQPGNVPVSPQSGLEPADLPEEKPMPAYPDLLILPDTESSEPQPFAWPEPAWEAMGYEGYWVKDFSEYRTGNPWTPEMQLDTLPVYRNAVLYNEELLPQADFALMQDILKAVVSRLGLDADSVSFSDNSATEEEKQAIREKYEEVGMPPPDESAFAPTAVYGKADGIRIQVNSSYRVKINFDKPRPYPQELLSGSAGLEQEEKKAAWLAEEYADLLHLQQPASAALGGDYASTLEQFYSIGIYDAAGSDLEKILHYNFYRAEFCDDDDGNLFLIRLSFPDLTDLLGNYPIITPEQAQQELLAGRYVTSVPDDKFTAEQIAHVELVYRASTYDPIYVPYYKFYVDVTDFPEYCTPENLEGMTNYGAYYVPAIDSEYLTDLPLWDGHIN